MNRNFRTLVKAHAFQDSLSQDQMKKAVQTVSTYLANKIDSYVEDAMDRYGVVSHSDLEDAIQDALNHSDFVTEDQMNEAIDDAGFVTDYDLGIAIDNAEFVTFDDLEDAGYLTESDLENNDYITEDDVYERIRSVLDDVGYVKLEDLEELIDESECMTNASIDISHLEQNVADLERKVKMLDVLAGLESVIKEADHE